MKGTICKYAVMGLAAVCLAACGNKSITEYHEGARDKVVDGVSLMVSIDDNLPFINSFAAPTMAGDTLIIVDFRSTDLLMTAYDIYSDSTLGRFGKYGNGPGEVGNPLIRIYNKYDNNFYFGNGNRGVMSTFFLPDAVSDSTYDAVDKMNMDFYQGIQSPYVIEKSTAICTSWSDVNSRDFRISKLNLDTGDVTLLDTVTSEDKMKMGIAVSEKNRRIYAFDRERDLICIYDLDGKLCKKIYGPEYDSDVEEYEYFFSSGVICGDKVAVTYTGRKQDTDRGQIILMDLDGRYLMTLQFDSTIHGLAYHDKTNRLYLTTTGEPQIGYIELDKLPD